MFLLNRGNSGTNVIFSMLLEEFTRYLAGDIDHVSSLKTFHVNLLEMGDYESTLSGAEFWPEQQSLIYTASIEATKDAYNDGEILGSFVGVVKVADLQEGKTLDLSHNTLPLKENGEMVITKVESVALHHSCKRGISGVLVSDNDDGTSEFFNFSLKLD